MADDAARIAQLQAELTESRERDAVAQAEITSLRAEVGQRDRALIEALEQQTATSEILRVIATSMVVPIAWRSASASPTETSPSAAASPAMSRARRSRIGRPTNGTPGLLLLPGALPATMTSLHGVGGGSSLMSADRTA